MTKNLASIDVGSNGIRLLICQDTGTHLVEIEKIREPVRLGLDVFQTGMISRFHVDQTVETFRKFADLCKKHHVTHLRAVATSAVRDAKNGTAFLKRLKSASGIRLEIITGDQEAELISNAVQQSIDFKEQTASLFDIGGGSVEITVLDNQKQIRRKSFQLGTLRILEDLKKRGWQESEANLIIAESLPDILSHLHGGTPLPPFKIVAGTGGNLEALAKLKLKLLNDPDTAYLKLHELEAIIASLRSLSVLQRQRVLGLKEDRADVILIAALLAHLVLVQSGQTHLHIPGVGLRDGLLSQLRGPQSSQYTWLYQPA